MDIKTQLNESLKTAMKSGDMTRKDTLRMALAAIKQVEVDKRITLDDAAVMALLQKEIKNRREAFEEGHVPGSAWIHVHELAPRRHELPGVKARRILLVGDDERRTGAAATWLALMGHADVAVLEGGFPAWTGPVESGPPPPPRPPGPQLRTL